MSNHMFLQRLDQECPVCKEIIDHTLTCGVSGKQRCPKCGSVLDAEEFKTVEPKPVDYVTYTTETQNRTSEVVTEKYVLPCFGIAVEVEQDKASGAYVGGTIDSELMPDLPEHIDQVFEDGNELALYKAAMDAVESVILSHAMAGIDVTMAEYVEGIKYMVHGIQRQYGVRER